MQTFQYKAVNQTGLPVKGTLNAANDIDLELRLKRMGLDLVTCHETGKSLTRRKGKISRQDLITFCFHLEQITRSGVPILEGMMDLRDGMDNPAFREVISALLEDMEGGKVLSQAMASHDAIFDSLFTNLVRAGEQTGKLPEVFENLATTLKWQDELISHTRRLMAYPLMVLFVVTAVIIFLLTYLVPQLVSLLKNMGVELPLQTRVLIFLSDAVLHYWPIIFGIPMIVFIGIVTAAKKNTKARYLMDSLQLRIPFTGPIMKKIILARFANFFALMYQSGITILDALKSCEGIVNNRVISEALHNAGQKISAGDGLTESFRSLGVFPPLVLRMLGVGEKTGALDIALLNVSYFYNREVKESIEKLLKLLEPALTVFLGIIMALIMFSILMPVYDVLGKFKF